MIHRPAKDSFVNNQHRFVNNRDNVNFTLVRSDQQERGLEFEQDDLRVSICNLQESNCYGEIIKDERIFGDQEE